jgi:hypothetical protein
MKEGEEKEEKRRDKRKKTNHSFFHAKSSEPSSYSWQSLEKRE